MKKPVFCVALIFGVLLTFGCGSIASIPYIPSGNSGNSGSSGSSGTSSNTGNSGSSQVEEHVQEVFSLTNSFRTGNEAYYWNSDNRTKTNLVGKLGTLKLDSDLCRAAKVRASEITRNFSHTRPDGRSCFTVLSDLSISYRGVGENIAAGNASGERTFNQWKEADQNYSGQGHRRNMLGDFTKIGIARAYDANSTYKYYWVMILSK